MDQGEAPQAPFKARIGWIKKLVIIAFWVIVGLLAYEMIGGRMSSDELGYEVKASMQESFRSNPELSRYSLSITDLTVVKVEGNQYRGLASVSHEGEIHKLPVEITYDGDSFMWNTDGSNFGFLAELERQRQHEELDKQLDAVSKQIEDGMRSYRERYE